MAGALLYVARMPATHQAAQFTEQAAASLDSAPSLEIVSHPTFTLPDVSGNDRMSSEWDGKKRILNFWATWCAPCRKEIPLLKAFQDQHGDDGFQILGIAVDFPEAVSAYAEAAEFNYPVLVGEMEAMALAESSGVEMIGLPFTMLMATDGELISTYMGELHQPQLDTIATVMSRLESKEISMDDARAALDGL